MKKAMAMKCTQENWDSIKDRIPKEYRVFSLGKFEKSTYIVLFEDKSITNGNTFDRSETDEIHETFNAKIFLDACGIETTPTLEEVKERFKDAKKMQSPLGNTKYKINTKKLGIYFDGKNYRQNKDSEYRELLLWEEFNGYAKILTYKTPKFEITNEQVLELSEKFGNDNYTGLRSNLTSHLKSVFPEVFKKELVVGKWYKCIEKGFESLVFITDLSKKTAYGFSHYGNRNKWCSNGNKGWSFEDTKNWTKATPQEVEVALIEEAKKRGYKKGVVCEFGTIKQQREIKTDDMRYSKKFNILEIGGNAVLQNGIWAEIIQPKKMTQSEIEKELGYKIDIV